MRRMVFAVVAALILGTGAILLTPDDCADWQDRYKQVLYSEMLKNSPLVLPYRKIEVMIGKRPIGCAGPPYELTQTDVERYRSQGIGKTTFNEESRAAFRQLQD